MSAPVLTGRALFAAAPRLERAHRDRAAEIIGLRAQRGRLTSLLLHHERLFAHRDLQLLRARQRKYTGTRLAKLRQAERELQLVRDALAKVEARLP